MNSPTDSHSICCTTVQRVNFASWLLIDSVPQSRGMMSCGGTACVPKWHPLPCMVHYRSTLYRDTGAIWDAHTVVGGYLSQPVGLRGRQGLPHRATLERGTVRPVVTFHTHQRPPQARHSMVPRPHKQQTPSMSAGVATNLVHGCISNGTLLAI